MFLIKLPLTPWLGPSVLLHFDYLQIMKLSLFHLTLLLLSFGSQIFYLPK